jgi:hypothetical protein
MDRNGQHHEEVRIPVEHGVKVAPEGRHHLGVTRNSPIEEVTETGHEKADAAHKERPSQPDEQGCRKRKKKPEKSEHIRADHPVSEQYPVNPQYSRIKGMAYFRAYQWLS